MPTLLFLRGVTGLHVFKQVPVLNIKTSLISIGQRQYPIIANCSIQTEIYHSLLYFFPSAIHKSQSVKYHWTGRKNYSELIKWDYKAVKVNLHSGVPLGCDIYMLSKWHSLFRAQRGSGDKELFAGLFVATLFEVTGRKLVRKRVLDENSYKLISWRFS